VSESTSRARLVGAAGTATASLEERYSLAENLLEPLNRYYRYPAARALFRVAGGLPLRPDHITYVHTVIGVCGAALLAWAPSRWSLILVFALLEIRMVLDCYDGVVARAKNLSSARGRTLDEVGDGVSVSALCIGLSIHIHHTHPGLPVALVVAIGVVILLTAALCGHSHDFYKRRLGSALKEGRDSIAEEVEQKYETVRAGRDNWLTDFGLWFDRWQVRLYETPYADGDAVGAVLSRVHRPGLRLLVRLVGLISGDTLLAVISVGILLDRVLSGVLIAVVYGLSMVAVARFTMWRAFEAGERT